ncbi:hypothetical protein J437_LFUL015322 [Ladona fulva]|uniref:C-type lectin domain-containing protein n=1 Tax=Ladona fulva TaxID=123851 RepID=A0A8K0KIT9_LADFU|nr:hypothetical protein J437_LFUL015322 [Ladona fulva]
MRRIRSGGDFVWTNTHPMSMEGGYWLERPPMHSSTPFCVALDPSADFRWRARSCGRESVASFLCQLPVPLWVGRGEGGCLPSLPPSTAPPMTWLTIQYLPEQGALDLTADCGPRGQRQLACKKGTTTGEELGWRLSCSEDLKLHIDDNGMRLRRGRPQTHAPPTRHRRDLTGTSMTTTQASSPSQMPLESQSAPLPSPLPPDPQNTTLSPITPSPSVPPQPADQPQNSTEDSQPVQVSSSVPSSDIKIVPISTFVTQSANVTSQSPSLNIPTSRPTPTHNLTVSLTVVISPASSEENDTGESTSEHSQDFTSQSSEKVISITDLTSDSSQLPSKSEGDEKLGAKVINLDVIYLDSTFPPEVNSQKVSTSPPTETTPKSSSVSFTPKSPPNMDESTISSVPVSVSTLALHPELPPVISESLSQPETQKPSLPPVTQSNSMSAMPLKMVPSTSDAPHISSSESSPITSLLTSPAVSESTHETLETSTLADTSNFATDTSSPYLPDTRVDILDGYGPSDPSNPAPKNIRITAVISNDLDDKVDEAAKQDSLKESLKDMPTVDVSQNEVLKQGNDDDGYQWIKVSAEKESTETEKTPVNLANEKNKDEVTLTVLSSDGSTTGQSSGSSSTDNRGHVEFDGEWTEVGTLDPVSERFLEEREEVDGDLSSPPPRPNRSRKLTRPQGRSFYTYFLSRVLG